MLSVLRNFEGQQESLARSAQRTAVKQRPHQETGRQQVATTEAVVLHHGREVDGDTQNEARPSASTACWAALAEAREISR
jgi:hypothetical protein